MQRKLIWVTVLLTAATLQFAERSLATPASGFTSTTIAFGRFNAIDVFNHLIVPRSLSSPNTHPHLNLGDVDLSLWFSWQKTNGLSDLYIQSNVWQPGGTTGWHSHPGHSLIVVTAGAVSDYDPNTTDCQPTVYTVGMGFIDSGGGHVHNIRNEGVVTASSIAVQLIPADADRRLDALQAPANCPAF